MLPVVLGKLDSVLHRRDKRSSNTGDDCDAVFGIFVLCIGQEELDCVDSDRRFYSMPCDIRSGEFYDLEGSKEI